MNKRIVTIGLLIVLLVAAFSSYAALAQKGKPRRITRAALEDKVRGGWAGQMIGVSYGAPTEFRSLGKIIEDNLRKYQDWTPERINNANNQDDLYVEMTFAEVMDRVGLDATTEQYGEAFKGSQYRLWHANAGARKALNRGIKAPLSGHPKYNIHANDIDFQIEADFIGLMTPGLPQESNKYCDRVGRVMNYGDGLYGGMFIAGMYGAAFFETDTRRIVEAGLATIPRASGYARVIQDVLDWSKQNPDDWKKTWHLATDKWDKDDACPSGVNHPFNIDARLNGAFVALGLLYGGGDFEKTLAVSTRSGQDSDCNPSSAAGVLGVVLGYERIPEKWKAGMPALAGKKFAFTNYSFDDIVKSTLTRATKVIAGAGGKVTDAEITIPYQAAKAPKLEQWDMGAFNQMVPIADAAWQWKGEWAEGDKLGMDGRPVTARKTSAAGAEAQRYSGHADRYARAGLRARRCLPGRQEGGRDRRLYRRAHD